MSCATSEKKFTERLFGWLAPGGLPVIGGSRTAGRATNGTLQQQSSVARLQSSANPSLTKIPWHFSALCTTCSVDIGSWRGRMTRAVLSSQFSVLSSRLLFPVVSSGFSVLSPQKIRVDKLWVLSVSMCLSGEWFY